MLSHIGLKEAENNNILARNAHFAIFPNSVLFKKQPKWVMAAELVETSKLWGRMVAEIEPEWIEPLAEHLIKKSYSEPRWSKSRGAVIADEKVTLYGVPIVAARPVNYGSIDPTVSREIFIQSALVEGDWNTKHKFFKENQRLVREVEELEHKAAAAIFWWMTVRFLNFTISVLVRKWFPKNILIPGGKRRNKKIRNCLILNAHS